MAATYDVTTHPRLTQEARDYDPDALDAEVEIAERLLGIHDTTYGPGTSEGDTIVLGLVLQVNDNIKRVKAWEGLNPFASAETRGPMSLSYRTPEDLRPINKTAWTLVSSVLPGDQSRADEYADIKSARFNSERST